jgi:anti-anti-sigma regulatory factor
MGHEPSSHPGSHLDVRQQHIGNRVVVTLTGSLDLDGVEDLAACADRICRSKARAASFDVTGVVAADDAGVRTLAAACRCLSLHGVVAEVRGIGGQFRQVLGQLGLTLPEPPARSAPRAAAGPARTPATRPASAAIGG